LPYLSDRSSYLFDQAKVPPNKVYLFNTHFFTRLTSTAPGQKGVINYEAVKRWAKEDIFSYDYIVVPVNEG
jgi:sentrin-specific protease 7